MRTLSLIVALLCSLQITAQSNVCNLSKMYEPDRNAYLIKKAKEVVMNFGPDYYREYGEPEISGIETLEERKYTEFNGEKYYTVTFRYDKTKETLEWDYAARVHIMEKDGEPWGVQFGNGLGLHFFRESYKEKLKRGIKKYEQAVYKQSNWIYETGITNNPARPSDNKVSFTLEELDAPAGLLKTRTVDEIYKYLLRKDYKSDVNTIDGIASQSKIIANSFGDRQIVGEYGYNPFFFGLCEAYANHRPVVLSPDVIWILISQGFANHINSNSRHFRNQIVDFDDRKELEIEVGGEPEKTDWYNVFESFYSGLSQDVKDNLAETLLCDFSTSTKVDRLVSQATIMETVESYYDFIVIYLVCGIPSITLEGTVQDWERVKEKTLALEKYDLGWWTDRLVPILDEFIAASKGNADIAFWKEMVHITKPGTCGDPRVIDGWITDLYPYDRDGKRMNGGKITDTDKLPGEISKVRIRTVYNNGLSSEAGPDVEVWAGIFGLEQNEENFAIKPVTGWLARTFDSAAIEKSIFAKANTPDSFYGIRIAVDSIPPVLKELGHIYKLDVSFNGKAFLPEWLSEIRIDRLVLRGDIPLKERRKAKKWFPHVEFKEVEDF